MRMGCPNAEIARSEPRMPRLVRELIFASMLPSLRLLLSDTHLLDAAYELNPTSPWLSACD